MAYSDPSGKSGGNSGFGRFNGVFIEIIQQIALAPCMIALIYDMGSKETIDTENLHSKMKLTRNSK